VGDAGVEGWAFKVMFVIEEKQPAAFFAITVCELPAAKPPYTNTAV